MNEVLMSHANGCLQYYILHANMVVAINLEWEWGHSGDVSRRLSDVHNEVATCTVYPIDKDYKNKGP